MRCATVRLCRIWAAACRRLRCSAWSVLNCPLLPAEIYNTVRINSVQTRLLRRHYTAVDVIGAPGINPRRPAFSVFKSLAQLVKPQICVNQAMCVVHAIKHSRVNISGYLVYHSHGELTAPERSCTEN